MMHEDVKFMSLTTVYPANTYIPRWECHCVTMFSTSVHYSRLPIYVRRCRRTRAQDSDSLWELSHIEMLRQLSSHISRSLSTDEFYLFFCNLVDKWRNHVVKCREIPWLWSNNCVSPQSVLVYKICMCPYTHTLVHI